MTDKKQSSVTKSDDWDVYHVRAGYEWATIALKGWQAKDFDKQPREIGEILIHSSYGSWAYQWSHLGRPFKQWLSTHDDKHYIAGKFLADKAYVFDGEKSVRDLRQSLIEHRRTGDISKNDARTIWDFIDENSFELESSADRFVQVLMDCARDADWQDEDPTHKYREHAPGRGARYFLAEPWERPSTSLNRQFSAFWDTIMPVFQQALRDELASAKAAA